MLNIHDAVSALDAVLGSVFAAAFKMRPHLVGQRHERRIIFLTHLFADRFQSLVEGKKPGVDILVREIANLVDNVGDVNIIDPS